MVSNGARLAYEKGYRVKGNSIVSPRGNIRRLKTDVPYPRFNIKRNGRTVTVKCHQLAAWQKYGENCLSPHIVIRHKNDNHKIFRLSNIELGTKDDNVDDRYVNAIIGHWVEELNAQTEDVPF